MKILAATRQMVLRRDGYRCVAPSLDGHAGWCRDAYGNVITKWYDRDMGPTYMQMNHVKAEGELAMGKKAASDGDHLVTLCPFHHTGTSAGSNWEAANRHRLRKYLEQFSDIHPRSHIRRGAP